MELASSAAPTWDTKRTSIRPSFGRFCKVFDSFRCQTEVSEPGEQLKLPAGPLSSLPLPLQVL